MHIILIHITYKPHYVHLLAQIFVLTRQAHLDEDVAINFSDIYPNCFNIKKIKEIKRRRRREIVKKWTNKGYNKGKRESYVKRTNYEEEERRQGIKTPIIGFPWGTKLTGYSDVLPMFMSRQSERRRDGGIN